MNYYNNRRDKKVCGENTPLRDVVYLGIEQFYCYDAISLGTYEECKSWKMQLPKVSYLSASLSPLSLLSVPGRREDETPWERGFHKSFACCVDL